MLKVPHLFRTYIWLVDTIMRHAPITLDTINTLWLRTTLSDGEPIHRNTFRRHLITIEEMFGIDFECDRRTNAYSIVGRGNLRQDNIARWMLSTMTVASVVRESRTLQKRILLEDVPSGQAHLTEITHAMEEGHSIDVYYQKFVDSEPYSCRLEPYCLKLFHQRWYLLAHRVDRTYLAIYALDRMTKVHEVDQAFSLPHDFDPSHHFRNLFGVFQPSTPDERPQRIIIRAYDGEWNYLRTLPLHASQRELTRAQAQHIIRKEDHSTPSQPHVDFALTLHPTLDFRLELLSRGDHIEVLEPATLRQQLQTMILKAASRYD